MTPTSLARHHAGQGLRRWAAVLAYAALIFFLSSRPAGTAPAWSISFLHHDKIAHALEYAGLGFLLERAFAVTVPSARAAAILALAVAFAYGAADEYHQSFVPGRQGNDPGDLLADIVGAALGAILVPALLRRLARPAPAPSQSSS